MKQQPSVETAAGLVLLGCVSGKREEPAPAKDLYLSPLWERRRAYALASGKPWAILSAEHGLLDPAEVVAPYDRELGAEPRSYREEWSRGVAAAVIARVRAVGARAVEIHAGKAYVESGLRQRLEEAGISVLLPLAGLRLGQQLAWYVARVRRPGRAGEPSRDGVALTILSLRETGPFTYRWPKGEEAFGDGQEGTVEVGGAQRRFRHGVGSRFVYGKEREHTVTFLEGKPVVEGVAADDFPRSRALLSLLKTAEGRMVRERGSVPCGYESFAVVSHRAEIDAPYSRYGLAVKILIDDVPAWVRHALLRTGALASAPRQEEAVPSGIASALLKFGAEILAAEGAPVGRPVFTSHSRANELLLTDPFAFLTAVIANYQVKAERAWKLPFLLSKRLGAFGPENLVEHPDEVRVALGRPPALHRFSNRLREFLVSAARRVLVEYGGDAGAIWGDEPTALNLRKRLERFLGIGQKKAAMTVEILARDLLVPIRQLEGSDIAYDVHLRRVFLRTGIADRDDLEHMVRAARRLHPERPGALDYPAWVVGRRWCRPAEPDCPSCVLAAHCEARLGAA